MKDLKEMTSVQRRVTSSAVSFRASEDVEGEVVRGYAARFNSPTILYDWGEERWEETIQPGFFNNVLEDDVRCLIDHESAKVLARSAAGNLRFGQDDVGLWYEFTPQGQSYAEDLVINLRNGNISQSSFGFLINKDGHGYEEKSEGNVLVVKRTLKADGCRQLLDVSPVTYPAYKSTDVGLKAMESGMEDFNAGLEEFRNKKKETKRAVVDHTRELLEFEILGL